MAAAITVFGLEITVLGGFFTDYFLRIELKRTKNTRNIYSALFDAGLRDRVP